MCRGLCEHPANRLLYILYKVYSLLGKTTEYLVLRNGDIKIWIDIHACGYLPAS